MHTPHSPQVPGKESSDEEWLAQYKASKAKQQVNNSPRSGRPDREDSALGAIRDTLREHPKASIATTAALAAGIFLLPNVTGSESNPQTTPEQAKVGEHILSVTLAPDATLRFDPYVKDDPENHNDAVHLQTGGEIVAEKRILVFNEHRNGTWYGLNIDWVRDTFAGELSDADKAALERDADNIIWVNEQGVSHVGYIDSQDDIQLPTLPESSDQ